METQTTPAPSPIVEKKPLFTFTKKRIFIIIGAVVAVVILAAGGFFVYQMLHADPQKQAQEELKATVAAVGKLIVLPDETPTMATVTDPAKLQDQTFFKNAKKGDKVLIYAGAAKAILYDPSINKIIEVAPINLGTTPPAQ